GSTTSLQGDIENNAMLVFDQDSYGTYAGVLSGSGAVRISGEGRVVFTGNNSYEGGTIIANGTLSVGADHNLGNASGALTLVRGGVLTIEGTDFNHTDRDVTLGTGGGAFDIADAGHTFAINGTIGADTKVTTLIKSGPGTLVLGADNTYVG